MTRNARYNVEKRIANTEQWDTVSRGHNRETAIVIAKNIIGGASTGVRIRRTDNAYIEPEMIVGH